MNMKNPRIDAAWMKACERVTIRRMLRDNPEMAEATRKIRLESESKQTGVIVDAEFKLIK